MKVLDVTEFYSERGGGVRSHLSQASQAACQLGVDHVIVAPGPEDAELDVSSANGVTQSPAPAERQASQGRHGSARVIRLAGPSLPYDPTYHLLWRVDRIRALVAKERPDVLGIHSPYFAAAACASVARAHFGVRVFTWHSDFIDTYLRVILQRHVKASLASVALEPLWAMVRRIARSCDATFVAAKWQAAKLESHGVPRVVQVPFGIEHGAFSPAAGSVARKNEILAKAGAGREGWTLLVGVGRFAVEKRWDVVIDAFCKLRQTRNAVLVLFGDGPERARMEARVAGRDDVVFAGFTRDRAELASALASADALVHGCPYETFGLSIAEALACGLPAVVPDEGGAAETIDDASGETYASLDPEECALAIARLLARDRSALRAGATAAAARVPDVRAQFAKTFDAYRELLARR